MASSDHRGLIERALAAGRVTLPASNDIFKTGESFELQESDDDNNARAAPGAASSGIKRARFPPKAKGKAGGGSGGGGDKKVKTKPAGGSNRQAWPRRASKKQQHRASTRMAETVMHADRDEGNGGGGQAAWGSPPKRHRFSETQLTPKSYEETEHGQEVYYDQQRTTMEELEREMMLYRNAHDNASAFFRLRYYALITVCLILSMGVTMLSGSMHVATATCTVATKDAQGGDLAAPTCATTSTCSDSFTLFKYLVTGLSCGNALAVALLAFLKYQSKMDAHGNAATQFGELYEGFHFSKFATQFTYMELDELLKKLDATKKSFMDVSRACPYSLPRGIQKKLTADLHEVETSRKKVFRKLSHARNPVAVTPVDEEE